METCVVERSVTRRAQQQGIRIRRLRERRAISKGRLMDALGFKTSRAYDLYEDGTSVIRMDRVEDWAEAFEMEPLSFVAALLEDESDAALRSRVESIVGPDEPRLTQDAVRDLQKRSPDAQSEGLESLSQMWDERRSQ